MRESLHSIVIEYGQFILIAVDGLLYEVAHQQWQFFCTALLLGIFGKIFAFCRKAHAKWRLWQAGNIRQNVRVGY